jgi:hypothetical protein
MSDETSNPGSPFYDNPKDDHIDVADQYELFTKFIFEPNHTHYGTEDFLNHINKTMTFTHTTDEEAIMIRPHLENITILNRHKEPKRVLVPTGEVEEYEVGEGDNKAVVRRPVFEERLEYTDRFAITIRNEITFVAGVNATAAGRGGALMKDSKTVKVDKEMTIEDRTDTRPGFWAKIKKK